MDALVQLASLISSSNTGPSAPVEPQSWTAHEDELLRTSVARYDGADWKSIARYVGQRTEEQCMERFQTISVPLRERSLWTREEDDRLKRLVDKYGPKYWTRLAEYMPGRHAKQCRERWLNHLDPGINHAEWTEQENGILVKMQAQIGNHWSKFREFLPGRPDNSIKNQWHTVLKPLLEGQGRYRQFLEPAEQVQDADYVPGRLAEGLRPHWRKRELPHQQHQQQMWQHAQREQLQREQHLRQLHQHALQSGVQSGSSAPLMPLDTAQLQAALPSRQAQIPPGQTPYSHHRSISLPPPATLAIPSSVHCEDWSPHSSHPTPASNQQVALSVQMPYQHSHAQPTPHSSQLPSTETLQMGALGWQFGPASMPHVGLQHSTAPAPAFVPYQATVGMPPPSLSAASVSEAATLAPFPGRPVRISQPVPRQTHAKGPLGMSNLATPSAGFQTLSDWRIAAYSMQPDENDELLAPSKTSSSSEASGQPLPVPIRIPHSAKRLRTGVISRTQSAPGAQLQAAREHAQSVERGLSMGNEAALSQLRPDLTGHKDRELEPVQETGQKDRLLQHCHEIEQKDARLNITKEPTQEMM